MRSGKSLSGGYARLRRCLRVLGSPAWAIWVTVAAYMELIHLLARAQSCFSNLPLRPVAYPWIPPRHSLHPLAQRTLPIHRATPGAGFVQPRV